MHASQVRPLRPRYNPIPMHGLNPPQAAAVLHIEGPLLVLAGAGSGKTRVIVEKIAHLIGSGRYPARRIAAITFTNKSAKEMRERVAKRLREQDADEVTICTFQCAGPEVPADRTRGRGPEAWLLDLRCR